jgi:hypothetical protein
MSLYYFTISAKNDCHVRSMDVKDRIKNNWLSEYSIALPERLIYKEDFDGQKELYILEKSMLDLSSDYVSDDYFGSFWTRQLALMVLNINRMEGTLSAPSSVDSVMMKSMFTLLTVFPINHFIKSSLFYIAYPLHIMKEIKFNNYRNFMAIITNRCWCIWWIQSGKCRNNVNFIYDITIIFFFIVSCKHIDRTR